MEIEVKAGDRKQILFNESDNQDLVIRVGEQGFLSATFVDLGSVERTVVIHLEGSGARAEILGATVLNDRHIAKTNLVVEHVVPQTHSSFVWSNLLNDQSRSEIVSRVIVCPAAQQSTANQSIKTMLLSNQARVITKPELEIRADEVKCSHGATIGSFDPSALAYLRARGLDIEQAKSILQLAFIRPSLIHLLEEDRVQVEELVLQELN